jgi:hypothetical protein
MTSPARDSSPHRHGRPSVRALRHVPVSSGHLSPFSPPSRLSSFVIARSAATRQSSRYRYVPMQPTGLPRRDFVPSRNDNKRGPDVHFYDDKRCSCVHFHDDEGRARNPFPAPILQPPFSPSRPLSSFVIARSAATRQSSRHRYVPMQPTGLPRRDYVPPRNDNKRGPGIHFHDDEGGARNPFPSIDFALNRFIPSTRALWTERNLSAAFGLWRSCKAKLFLVFNWFHAHSLSFPKTFSHAS